MPRKKRRHSYYNAAFKEGYDIINNSTLLNAVGAAEQQHDLDAAQQIDLFTRRQMRKLRQEDAENTSQKTNKKPALDDFQENPEKYMSYDKDGNPIYFNPISVAASSGVSDDTRRDIPEGYGITDLLSDNWNNFYSKLNELQAESARGYQARAMNDRALIKDYEDSLDILDEIDKIDKRLQQINGLYKNRELDSKQKNSLFSEVNQLTSRKINLQSEYSRLEPSRKKLEDTVNQTWIGSLWDNVMSGNKIYGDILSPIFGKTTAAHDEMNDARRFLYNLGDKDLSRKDARTALNAAKAEYDKLNIGWQSVIDENEADAKKYKDKISGWFQDKDSKTAINFTDPDTYLFKMSGLLGGSASSYTKQIPAMIAGLIGGYGAKRLGASAIAGKNPLLGLGAAASGIGGLGTSFYFNRAAGVEENNAEVAMSVRELVKERTGLSEEDINDIIAGKQVDRKKLRKVAEVVGSSENLFNYDMAATTWDAAVQSVLDTVPIGAISGLNKFVKGSRYFRKAITNPAVKKILRSDIVKNKIGEEVIRDLRQGAKFADVAGPAASASTAVANAVAKGAARKLEDLYIKKSAGTLVGKLGEEFSTRMGMFADAVKELNPIELSARAALKQGTNSKYIRGIGGKLIKSSISEGIEEGKQHTYSEAFKRGELNGDIRSTFDVALGDMVNGFTMGAHILGIPLDALGLIDIKDQDLLQEIKGGMLGGWGHTATVTALQEGFPYIVDRNADSIALESLYNSKLESQAKLKQYRSWLDGGLFQPGHQQILRSIDAFEDINNKQKQSTGKYAVDPQLIDQTRKKLGQLFRIAADPITKKQAESAGIAIDGKWKSNPEYKDFVAAKAVAIDKINEVRENLRESIDNVEKVERNVEQSLAQSNINQDDVNSILSLLDSTPTNDTQVPKKEGFGEAQTSDQKAEQFERLTKTVLEESDNDFQYTQRIAYLAALMEYRNQLERGLEIQKDNPDAKIRKNLKQQLKSINGKINEFSQIFSDFIQSAGIDVDNGLINRVNADKQIKTLEDVEQFLAYNQDEHEQLKDAYLDQLKWENEYDSAKAAYEQFVGKMQFVDKDGNKIDVSKEDFDKISLGDLNNISFVGSNAKNVIDKIHKMQDDDDKFEDLIELDYQEGLRAEHINDERGWDQPQINPKTTRPVTDAKGDQIKVQFDEQGHILNQNGTPRELAEGEFVDDLGNLWEDTTPKSKNPFDYKQISRREFDEQSNRLFRATWNRNHDVPLPLSASGYTEQMIIGGLKQTLLSPSVPPEKKKYVTPEIEVKQKPKKPYVIPTIQVKPQEEKSIQDQMLEDLVHAYEISEELVQEDENGYHTTGEDYFIIPNYGDPDSRVVRMSRVHSVKPKNYIRPDVENKINAEFERLKSFTSLQDIRKYLSKYDDQERIHKQLIAYYKYFEDNENIFFDNPVGENLQELHRTLKSIATITQSREPGVSVNVGNIVDELSRNFFGSDLLYAKTSSTEGILELFNSKNEFSGKSYAELFGNDIKAFESLINQLRNQYEYYTKKLGWKLNALPITWHQEFNSVGYVAGQTDLIGIDKDGGIHIIDFKTSKYSFLQDYSINDTTVQLQQDYAAELNILTKEDFDGNKLSKRARNILKNISQDSNVKNLNLRWIERKDGTGSAVLEVKTRSFTGIPNRQYGQVLSSYIDYSNQQTAYAELISYNTGNQVKSIEILGFKVSYDFYHEPNRIWGIDLEGRIPLNFSSNMSNILNEDENINDVVVQTLRGELSNKLDHLASIFDMLHKRVDHIFDDLSFDGKMVWSDFVSKVHNIVIPDDNALPEDIKTVIDDVDYLLKEAESTWKRIIDDYNKNTSERTDKVEIQQHSQQAEDDHQAQPQEVGEPSGEVYAKNKKKSKGNTSRTNLAYQYVQSIHSLEIATSAPDFITDSEFELYTQDGKLFCKITYHGNVWPSVPIDISYNGKMTTNGEILYNKVQELEKTKKPGQKIIAKKDAVSRTNGRIKLARDQRGNVAYIQIQQTDLFANEDLFDIEFSTTYGNIGFVDDKQQLITFDSASGINVPMLFQFSHDVPAPGTLVYLKHVGRNELNRDAIIPIAIDRVTLKDSDIDFIFDLIKNPDLLDKPYILNINGESVNINATGRQLSNVLFTIVDHPSQLTRALQILRTENPQVVELTNMQDYQNGIHHTYNLSIPQQAEALRNQLKQLSICERHDVLRTRLGEDSNPLLPFQAIKKFFNEANRGENKIQELKITETLGFSLSDFIKHTSKSGIQRNGLNGFAYYLKHNMLRTQYASLGSSNVTIGDVIIDNGENIDIQPTGAVITKPQDQSDLKEDDVIVGEDIDSLLKKIYTKGRKDRINKTKAQKHVEKILGKFDVEFQDTFISGLHCPAFVIGACRADSIILSSYAYNGVEYHEAFHRIFELLMDERDRDRLYRILAKRLGLELYDANGNEIVGSFVQVAEYAADQYMDFMRYQIKDVHIPFVTKLLNAIARFVRTMLGITDRDLAKVFVEVNDGKYKGVEPSKKAINRFNRLYKDLYCQIHGVDFENIVNRPMYDTLRETVKFCIIQGQNVDKSGRNIQNIGRHIDKETFKAGIDKLLKLGYDIIGQNTENPTVGQLAMRELYEKFDNEFLRDDLANQISIISTDYRKEIEDESIENAQGDSEDVKQSSIGEHTRASYEFSRFTKTSSRVRFFFATIPDSEYVNVKTVDSNGNPIVVRKSRLALNDYGMPTFIPVKVMFNEFLNNFYDIDTYQELEDRMSKLAKDDPSYSTLLSAIRKMYKSIYTVENGKIVRNSDQEALFSQIFNIVRSHKHKFMLAKANTQNGINGTYTIVMQSTDTEYNAHFYPTMWNQMLVNGGTIAVKISKTGKRIYNPNIKGSEYIFGEIANLFDLAPKTVTTQSGQYRIVGIRQWLNNALTSTPQNDFYLPIKVNGQLQFYNNPVDPSQFEIVKDKIIQALNMIGINFTLPELNYMLIHKYGSNDYKALAKMFNSSNKNDSMTSFLQFLRDVQNSKEIPEELRISGKTVKFANAYGKIAFIRELSNYKYQYRHSHDQLTVLATGNNKFYEISDNNFATDVVRSMNKRDRMFQSLLQDKFNYYEDEKNKSATGDVPVYGSLILEEMQKFVLEPVRNKDGSFVSVETDENGVPTQEIPDEYQVIEGVLYKKKYIHYISTEDFSGFKTDKRDDYGKDYFEIGPREDYVAKATILQDGGIIFPTLSDKKTWLYLKGIKLPGLDYSNIVDNNGNISPMNNLGDQFVIMGDNQPYPMLSYDPQVIDQFIKYAYSEYESVKQADADLDKMEANGTKSTDVENYYTLEQGAKFSSLLGVWVYDYKKDKDGQNVISGEHFESFNFQKNRKDGIKKAETFFFNLSRQEQEAAIARLLHKALLKEIQKAESLGLIEKVGNSENIFLNYKNIGFDTNAIDSIYQSLIVKNGAPKDGISQDKYKSLAVMIYLNDISQKAIMSGQEFERVFSGNPAFYAWKYDEGVLVDRTVDELKRFGGIVSTGNNNFMELQDIPEKYLDSDGNFTGQYICAEVKDEIVSSSQFDEIHQMMQDGQIRLAAYLEEESQQISEFREDIDRIMAIVNKDPENFNRLSEQDQNLYLEVQEVGIQEYEFNLRKAISEKIDSKSIDELKNSIPSYIVDAAINKANESANSYIGDINVADGAAYITDTMAEMLLRMNGNYSSQIAKAFDILRSKSWRTITEKVDAYNKIVTTVIGTQKYTAFGRRVHPETGISIPYYNKMALFPIFECVATGRLANVFHKMQNQGIDMLMMQSAVKVGSFGAKKIKWQDYRQSEDEKDPKNHIDENVNLELKPTFEDSFQFTTYNQKFQYLRKQLNTDPKEQWKMSMGTQMTKIALSNCIDGRIYTTPDGRRVYGKELVQDIMDTIKDMSFVGIKSIFKQFFKTDKQGNLVDSDGNVIDFSSPNVFDKVVLDDVKFSRELSRLLSQKNPDRNILDAIELHETVDSDGQTRKHMTMSLNAVSNSTLLESTLISEINKKIIDIETPGSAFIQRSVWATEQSRLFERKKGEIIDDGDLPVEINGGMKLKMMNGVDGSMDCVVSFDFIKKMFGGDMPRVPIKKNGSVVWDIVTKKDKHGNVVMEDGKPVYVQKRDKSGQLMFDKEGNPVWKRQIRTREMTFEETKKWLINRGIIGQSAKACMIGYRIPTQAQSSIHALRIVDILPVVNDTIILPEEFTKITGSDFDIDKLFLSSLFFKVNRQEGEDGKFHQTVTSSFEKGTPEYNQNKLIYDYMTFLLDVDENGKTRSVNMLHRSIDNDTKLLKDVLKVLESDKKKEPEQPYGFYSLSTQSDSKNEYVNGKIGIGPFALNNNNHILTMLYHVRFKHIKSSIMSALDLEYLDRQIDQDGNSIMSWLSALINAHVDIAKDPYISRMNVNQFTYNLVNLLIRTGFGENTFYFINQPIMKDLAEAYKNANSLYMADQYSSIYKLKKDAVQQVEDTWFKPLIDSDYKVGGYSVATLIMACKEGGPALAEVRESINVRIKDAFRESMFVKDAVNQTRDAERQFLMYLAYLQFDKYANALSSLVKYSKIDTKKHGKTAIEQLIYQKGYQRVYDTDRDDNLFESSGINAMADDSYISTKTENAINTTRKILSSSFIQSTRAFINTVDSIQRYIGKQDSMSVETAKDISSILGAAIKSKFFVENYVPRISDNPHFIHDLVSDSVEDSEFVVEQAGNVIKLNKKLQYSLESYFNNTVHIYYVGQDNKYHLVDATVVGYDDEANTIIINKKAPIMHGKLVLTGGRNTIYDRFAKLCIDIHTDPRYSNLLNGGEIGNRLLQMLVPAKEYSYESAGIYGERPDTYQNAKFVKLFNFVDDGGDTANYIIDAWEELLEYENDDIDAQNTIRSFARDLVVYAFITSGDESGFTKMFKYVPDSWRISSGYSDFMNGKLVEYSIGMNVDDIDIQDVILNNWYNNRIVPVYRMKDRVTKKDNFLAYYTKKNGVAYGYPTMLAALTKNDSGQFEPSIDPDAAPIFIKVPRRKGYSGNDSQRKYTVYKLHAIALSNTGVPYPVYIKVNPKGMKVSGGFMITEYGRSDFASPYEQEYTINESALEAAYKAADVGKHVRVVAANGEANYAAIISGLNRAYIEQQQFVDDNGDYIPNVPQEQTVSPERVVYSNESTISTVGYKKGDPQAHKDTAIVFTENAQANASALGLDDSWVEDGYPKGDMVKTGVSDMNGTNQAGVRASTSGTYGRQNINSNAFGIIVKKYQQDKSGKFIASEGQFKDTDTDFELFKAANLDMFKRLEESGLEKIMWPSQMGLGKAALPQRFAEWLQKELDSRFGIVSEIQKNPRTDYEGYGLRLISVNTSQSHEENSLNSGLFDDPNSTTYSDKC